MFNHIQQRRDIDIEALRVAQADEAEAVREAEAKGLSVSSANMVDCGFEYQVWEFYVYGPKPGGNRRRLGAIQDRPGSSLWRVHGMTQTFTLAGIVRHLTAAIIDGAAL